MGVKLIIETICLRDFESVWGPNTQGLFEDWIRFRMQVIPNVYQ